MIPGKVSCLQATYGRHGLVQQTLACFMNQDLPYFQRELVILNNHPVALSCSQENVRIINEPVHKTLGHCRNRLLDFADGEFFRIWDDDDVYLPWTLSQGVERIGASHAWKPHRSWWFDGAKRKFELAGNAMEASILWRTDVVKRHGFFEGEGNESGPLLEKIHVEETEMGEWASYCYRWGCGAWHASGSIGNGMSEEIRAYDWKSHNNDVRPGEALIPDLDTVNVWYRLMGQAVDPQLQTAWMKAALGLGPAHESPLPKCFGEVSLRRDAKIVAVPGCWDMLHEGHVHTLQWAKKQGTNLIVLVNTDDGVTQQKGNGRPLVPLAGRIASLQALDCVDGIRIVGGVDDLPVLEKLKPDILVKGSEYLGREGVIPCPEGCKLLIAPEGEFLLHTSDITYKVTS